MRIGILGPLEVRDEAGRAVEVSGRRLRALLIRLAIEAGRAVSAERLLDDLWEGAPPAGGTGALQALVSRLRGAAGRDLVGHGPAGYRLAVEPAEIDAFAFERAVLAARREHEPESRAERLRDALDLWRGPALSDVADAAFAVAEVSRLGELRLSAIEDRADAELALGRPAAPLVPELEALAEANPLRERLRALLMRALYAAGRQADALQLYEDGRRQLADRLGVDPSPELAAAHLAILRGQVTPRASVSATADVRTTSRTSHTTSRMSHTTSRTSHRTRRTTNLPSQLTSFVGREEESERVGKLLRDGRLVTLTGPGGAGKTRLASEAAAPFVAELPDGVWFVPLASVSDAGEVTQAVLAALGVVDVVRSAESRSTVRPADRLADFLAGKQMILVLDNCEHLIDAVAALVDRTLGDAPGVRVLATSREPLGITGEALCPVPSLPLPPAGSDAGEAMRYASVRLFADRAAAARPGFAVDDASAPQVVAICRELDGIPLAIELAAARLRSLTPTQIAGRLGDRFRLLTGGSRTALPRHRTLRAVVDWSWDLLDDAERTVLRRLSVFAGGATPDGVARVCAPGRLTDDVIDVVAALIDKSLVIADGHAEVRYRLLETVRVYAAERLEEAGEGDRIRSAHAAYFLELAERADPELRRADQLLWMNRLTAERDNCSAAFRHIIETRDVTTGLRLVAALVWFWVMRDLEMEAGTWAVAVMDIADDTAPPGLEEQYAMAKCAASLITEMSCDPATLENLQAALEVIMATVPEEPQHPALILARGVGAFLTGDLAAAERGMRNAYDHPDPWIRAIARVGLGVMAANGGDVERAGAELGAGLAGFRAIGERWGMITALSGAMQVALARGDAEEAVRLGEEAYGYAAEGVSPEQGGTVLLSLARARAETGDLVRARAETERAVADMERFGEYADAANGYLNLSELARREGDLATTRILLERARELVEPRAYRADVRSVCARTFSHLGRLAEQQGDLESAERFHARALSDIAESVLIGNPTLAEIIEGVAALDTARGDHERAAELLGAAHSLRGYRDRWSIDAKRVTSAAIGALGEKAFAEAYDRGRAMPREGVLALVP
ncbi:AfsR/SARP family transcriptional regulator [Actinomadura rudentiformis]|uniref:AfsR/SARP family transcriptional regulator n=1 Tax=Actinomadura rudentiformis TaxID=359158 RepID=A0A6H9YHU7_9ACTN|nr:BTAD domain-containing putative transcriptional regulator [Actinomadura rudentiformis]KAB2339156.1 AfsR/SARP family transcriptional regulator [Actinomadura rudentiformis]